MSKRIREVVDSREVAHLWAHQSQQHARNKCRNFYFSGESLWSYGSHFEVGRIVKKRKGTVALITTRRYSSTTAGHICDAKRAVSHMKVFEVPLGHGGPREWMKSYLARVTDALDKAKTARLYRERNFDEAKRLVTEANEMAAFFGLRTRLSVPDNLDEAIAAAKEADKKQQQREAARLARQERERKRREAEALHKLLEEDLPKWRKGDIGLYRLPNRHLLQHDCLRLCMSGEDGPQVETTQGVCFPLDHGARAYPLLKRLRDRQETFHTNGRVIRLGHYQIDRMDADGLIHAGCHTVPWSEVEQLARAAGWEAELVTSK